MAEANSSGRIWARKRLKLATTQVKPAWERRRKRSSVLINKETGLEGRKSQLGCSRKVKTKGRSPKLWAKLLVSSKTPDERRAGTSQIWFQPDGSSQARLVADNIAPGNFASGIAAYQVGATYNLGLIFDNDPELTTTPSRFLLLEDISL